MVGISRISGRKGIERGRFPTPRFKGAERGRGIQGNAGRNAYLLESDPGKRI